MTHEIDIVQELQNIADQESAEPKAFWSVRDAVILSAMSEIMQLREALALAIKSYDSIVHDEYGGTCFLDEMLSVVDSGRKLLELPR